MNLKVSRCGIAALACALVGGSPCLATPVLGQRDDFNDGSAKNWSNGSQAADPQVIFSGGPGGASDPYLQLFSTGMGTGGSRAIIYNRNQWIGTFPGTIRAVEMDLQNFSSIPVQMRIAFKAGISANYTSYATTDAANLTADGLWHHVRFDLTDAAMTNLSGNDTAVATALGDVTEFRILHSATPAFLGDYVATTIGVDNVTAMGAAPEPGALSIVGVAALATLARRRPPRRYFAASV